MTPEERERFKEAEKEHLRQLKTLKEAARQTRRRASVNTALSDMAGALGHQDDPLDVHNEMLGKLERDVAQQEARLEIALENTALKDAAAQAGPPQPSPEQLEEETMKARAKTLVEQMKLQMGMTSPDADNETPASPSKTIGKKPPPAAETKPSPSSDRPEKTIGRMK